MKIIDEICLGIRGITYVPDWYGSEKCQPIVDSHPQLFIVGHLLERFSPEANPLVATQIEKNGFLRGVNYEAH